MISLSVPTRKRVSGLNRLIDSINTTTTELERANIELCFYVDEDDEESIARIHEIAETMPCQAVIAAPCNVRRTPQSYMHNSTYSVCTGPYYMVCADDIAFRTNGWYSAIMEGFAQYDDKIVQVYANDGFQSGTVPVATHGFYHKNWIDTLGYVYPPQFHVAYMDTWSTALAEELKRRVYYKNILIEHLHPAAGKGLWDDNYTNKIENGGTDGEKRMYYGDEGGQLRRADIAKLRQFIDSYKK